MSAQLCKERKDYYAELEKVQNGDLDITSWIVWYIECMKRAVLSSLDELNLIIKRKEFWKKIDLVTPSINERQRKISTLLLDEFKGNLNSTKYAKICKCSQDTASRDLEKLTECRILSKSESRGKSTSYSLIF